MPLPTTPRNFSAKITKGLGLLYEKEWTILFLPVPFADSHTATHAMRGQCVSFLDLNHMRTHKGLVPVTAKKMYICAAIHFRTGHAYQRLLLHPVVDPFSRNFSALHPSLQEEEKGISSRRSTYKSHTKSPSAAAFGTNKPTVLATEKICNRQEQTNFIFLVMTHFFFIPC